MSITKTYLKDLTYKVNGAAIEVHKALGPGLLKSVYHRCFEKELEFQGIQFVSEMSVPVVYKGVSVDVNLRCDLFIENILAVELKSVEMVHPVHEAQLLTYMKLLAAPKGILFNFNVDNLYKEGQLTLVSKSFETLPL